MVPVVLFGLFVEVSLTTDSHKFIDNAVYHESRDNTIPQGLGIGLPPVIQHGSDYLKKKVVPACLGGDKVICLAITEPTAGSDVAGLKCEARDEGDHYIVNGEKVPRHFMNCLFGVILGYDSTLIHIYLSI